MNHLAIYYKGPFMPGNLLNRKHSSGNTEQNLMKVLKRGKLFALSFYLIGVLYCKNSVESVALGKALT